MSLTVWIDADGCPAAVKDVVFRAAGRRQVKVTVVANSALSVPKSPLISQLCVPGGPDQADDRIAEAVAPGDVVVTSDVPLAARVVEKGAVALDHRGQLSDETNVRERLSLRNLMHQARAAGMIAGGPPAFSPSDKRRFADALDRLLTRLLQEPRSA